MVENDFSIRMALLERDLHDRVFQDESRYSREDRESDSLYGHLERVAKFAREIGRSEGVDPFTCYLAGLFHDAGKFAGGKYHVGDTPEEELSIQVLTEFGLKHGIDGTIIHDVAEAIQQIYRDDPNLTPLARVLFDADNLDKLGPLGIASYFVKTGLRGSGISEEILYKLTVELTYARYAPLALATKSGRELARLNAPFTIRFIYDLLDSLRKSGLYDFRVNEIVFDGLTFDVVAPIACSCGGEIKRRIWKIPGKKCVEIHLEHSCSGCNNKNEIRFCRPRLGFAVCV
ncbi:MAG: HD domain-containing protein [Acidobacteriota bacterium]|nr:HD domain-containing protein [Acidobacteriota bacterium]